MYRHLVFCLIFLFGLTLNAQTTATINIHGKITDAKNNNAAVSGAVVTLLGQDMTSTTNDNGEYAITNVSAVISSKMPQTEKIVFQKGVLELSLSNSAPLKVEIFDVKGKLLKKEVTSNAAVGIYRMNIAEISRVSRILIINAAIGKRTTTYRYLPLFNGSYSRIPAEHITLEGGRLAKVAAVVDTLEVVKDGFETKKVPVESLEGSIDIPIDSTINNDVLAIRLDQERQPIQGFGLNIALAPRGLGTSVMNALYDPKMTDKDALGCAILRVGMNTDGSLSGNSSDMSVARNHGAKIIGSCWSVPGNWKDNGRTDRGGHLLSNYYEQWATRIADFGKNQNLYAMSIANESDFASCKGNPVCTDDYATMVYTANEMVKFVKVAGKIFDERAPDVKMIAPEASEWVHVWSTASGTGSIVGGHPQSSDPLGCGCFSNEQDETGCKQKCLDGDGYGYARWLAKDEEAWDAFDILGVHEYDSQRAYPWPADVTGGVRTKEIWQTEMSGVMHWPEQGPSKSIENGVAVARWIQSALTIGEASAWLYWWYEAYYQNDNEGLALTKGGGGKAKRYYTFGNYSRYMRPGQTVVNITGIDQLPEKVLLTASKDDDGKVVIVAVNETTSEQSVPIKIAGGTAPASFKPIVTNGSENWSEKSAVSVTDGVLTMQLEKMSVTTFMSE